MRFFFAWVNADETTFGPEHQREDESVFSFTVSQAEGDFASLAIDILNPRIGLLAPGRTTWAWLSYLPDDASEEATAIPLFFGRLVAIPDDIQNEVVSLSFLARPSDYEGQIETIAESLRVLPYFDPVFISQDDRSNPDMVLESRSAVWSVDRVTHQVGISDIINGEDGTIVFGPDDLFYDGLSIKIGQTPVRKVIVDATLGWDQKSSRDYNVVPLITSQFGIDTWRMGSFNGPGFEGDFPKLNAGFNGGWKVTAAKLTRADGFIYPAIQVSNPDDHDGPLINVRGIKVPLVRPGFTIDDWRAQVTNEGNVIGPYAVIVPSTWLPVLRVGYDVSRSRTETVHFELSSDVQALLTEPGEEEILLYSVSSQEIDKTIDADGQMPLRDPIRRSYLTTDRGHQSLEYLIAVARAKLLFRARAVEVSVDMKFEDAIELSCRKNLTVEDGRIPGGSATGKVIAYKFGVDGDSGKLTGSATIGCTIGTGNSLTADPGTPSYVTTGYVQKGYQFYIGAVNLTIDSSVSYGEYSDTQPNDDGIDFATFGLNKAVINCVVTNPPGEQRHALETSVFVDESAISEFLAARATHVSLEMKPVTGGPFVTPYNIDVSSLMVPKSIDLEAGV